MKYYFPSNGTEGMSFMSDWCEQCTKDTTLRGGETCCTILTGSMVNDKPVKQWIYDENGKATCTSFRKVGSVVRRKIRKSEKTIDIFSDELTPVETKMLQFHKQT